MPSPYTKRRSVAAPPSVTRRSKGGFFYKPILFTLFLLALPLFPSQAPEFVGSETVLTKFWELIHLLFVGIAVAYGLFSRRSVESSLDSRMMSRVVDQSSLSYVSSFFPVSSVFDEDSCDFRSYESNVSARGSLAVVNERESESFSQVQAWNSQYYQGRSKVVVVARPDYGLDVHVAHQPLGLPVRSLRSGLRDGAALEDSYCDEAVNEEAGESLADKDFDEVVAAPPSPPVVVPWDSRPEMMAMGDDYLSNFQPLSVDETHYAAFESRSSQSTASSSSSSSSRTSFESHTQNRFSPSRSVSEELLDPNVDEPVKEKSLEASSRSSSPSLPPSPPLVTDDTHRRVLHSRHYSDGSLLEEDVRQGLEDELERSEIRDRRTEIFSKKELGSKSLKLTAESSRKGKNKSRRSYPPDPISSPVSGADDSTTRRRDRDDQLLEDNSDDHLLEDSTRKGLESDHNKLSVKKGRSHESLELIAEASSLTIPAVGVLLQPTNTKASKRAMRSSREGRDTLPVKDIKRNSEDDFVDLDKSRKKELHGDNKEVKSSSPRREPQSWRGSSKASSRGKSVRTIRSDRHGKHLKADGDSSHDRTEPKAESHGRTKPRRQWQQELAIVLHKEKLPETHAKSEPEDDDATEETEVKQLQLTLEEEEEAAAAWESQSNASHDHYEVDRKADEFIAKFREQIRLQKLHSGEQPRGGGIGIIRNSHFR
ncbi:BnaC06g42790D [Brassica napus]|uniref:BnaC06g42790D protein n=2 Tax=Brassica napus TaxID=3708 RepID=A0A078JHA6_BRANA|nr:BnaC06g42790D [Brassica napus]